MHRTFAAEMLVHCEDVCTIGKITVTMTTFLFQYYVFCGSRMYVRQSIFQMLSRSPEKHQARPVWRWVASSSPNYTLSCSVTLVQPGSPGRLVALQGRPVSSAGTSALGAVDDKTMHWVVKKLSMDLTFYKFQANNRTPQCVSITNTVLCNVRFQIPRITTNARNSYYNPLSI